MPAEDYGPELVVNVTTGETALVPLTPEEVALRDAVAAEAAAEIAVEQSIEVIRSDAEEWLFGTPEWVSWSPQETYDFLYAAFSNLPTAQRAAVANMGLLLATLRDYVAPETRASHEE